MKVTLSSWSVANTMRSGDLGAKGAVNHSSCQDAAPAFSRSSKPESTNGGCRFTARSWATLKPNCEEMDWP
ncbi:hypothetical protein COEX109129_33415 [Corallococcus exiguus]